MEHTGECPLVQHAVCVYVSLSLSPSLCLSRSPSLAVSHSISVLPFLCADCAQCLCSALCVCVCLCLKQMQHPTETHTRRGFLLCVYRSFFFFFLFAVILLRWYSRVSPDWSDAGSLISLMRLIFTDTRCRFRLRFPEAWMDP